MSELKRAIGPAQLMLYGTGSILGAGIYGLVGKTAGVIAGGLDRLSGGNCPALLTDISHASITSRYHKATGAATRRSMPIGCLG